MPGYCSTRANLASTRAPGAPRIAWTTVLGSTLQPLEAVVDATGRIYATAGPAPPLGQTAVIPQTIVAIDPGGAVAWTRTFEVRVSSLLLLGDGRLRLTLHYEDPSPRDPIGTGSPALVAVGADGSVASKNTLHGLMGSDFAVDAEGSLYSAVGDGLAPYLVAKMAVDGTIVWTSAPIRSYAAGISEVALTREGSVVVETGNHDTAPRSTLLELDPSGAVAWTRGFGGDFAAGPAVAPDGTIRVVTVTPGPALELYAIDTTGEVVWRTEVGSEVWSCPVAIGPDGTTILRGSKAIYAVDVTGRLLWQRPMPMPSNCYAVIDPWGSLVSLGGSNPSTIVGIETKTGIQLWSVAAPSSQRDPQGTPLELTGFALGPSGSVVALTGEGFTLLRDP